MCLSQVITLIFTGLALSPCVPVLSQDLDFYWFNPVTLCSCSKPGPRFFQIFSLLIFLCVFRVWSCIVDHFCVIFLLSIRSDIILVVLCTGITFLMLYSFLWWSEGTHFLSFSNPCHVYKVFAYIQELVCKFWYLIFGDFFTERISTLFFIQFIFLNLKW